MSERFMIHLLWAGVAITMAFMLALLRDHSEQMRYNVLNKMQDASLGINPAFHQGEAERGKNNGKSKKEKEHQIKKTNIPEVITTEY